ncbi:hypothetical protein LTR22_026953 [Elasticomyces elasticus]|nr:hypothetical protein LTR22_026953 [Elasticomyces elasticus]KAK5736378.1 hypothetical protein LTS12_026193 [Elasticomyces elasticus]
MDLEYEGPSKDEQGYDPRGVIPDADHGSVLITTRLAGMKRLGDSLHLGRVNDVEAKAILQSSAKKPLQDVDLLLRKLNGLPLALTQAGAYIGRTGIDVPTYIRHFDGTWSNLVRKQDRFPLQEYAERSMLTTWKISYEQVLRQSKAVALLLKLWALFSPDDVYAFSASQVVRVVMCGGRRRPAVSSAVRMHAGGVGTLLSGKVRILEDGPAAPPTHHAHVVEAQGKLREAKLMYEQALAGYENALGPEHTSTLATVNNLGLLYADQGKLNKAEKMYEQALAGYENALGPEHTSTLATINNLGLLYADQGKLNKAEKMYERALVGYEKAVGPEHTSILHMVNNLGLLYADQGKLDKAEKMFDWVLAGYEKVLGSEHTSTLHTVNNMGKLYKDQGKLDEAEKMYKRALAGREKALGPEHSSILGTVHGLHSLYYNQAWTTHIRGVEGRVRLISATLRSRSSSSTPFVPKLLKSYKRFPRCDISLFGEVGRILIWAGDDENARIAFQQQINEYNGIWRHGDAYCGACNQTLSLVTKRFVRKACKDGDLCEACYRDYEVLDITEGAMAGCSDHQFLAVPQPECSRETSIQVQGLTAWVDHMLHLYLGDPS